VLVEPASSAGRRFVTAHAILLSLAGIPAIYFHSLFGSHGDSAAVARTGAPRSINREKLAVGSLEAQLSDPRSERSRLYNALKTLLQIRATLPALHPDAAQKVLDVGPLTFGVRRDSPEGQQVFCLAGVGAQATRLALAGRGATGTDLVTGEPVPLDAVPLDPLQVRWIVAARD
jgi:sucrose phosphorylase